MEQEYINKHRERLSELSNDDLRARDAYLGRLADGTLQGPPTDVPSLNRVHNKYYSNEDLNYSDIKCNMLQYLYECNKDYLDDIAIDWHVKITYRDLFRNIEKMKKYLQSQGVKKGDVVSIAMTFVPETIYALYAINDLGATFNLCDPRVPAEVFKNYVNGVEEKFGKKSNVLLTFDIVGPKIDKFINDTGLEKVIKISPVNSLPKTLQVAKKLKDTIQGNKKPTKTTNSKIIEYDNTYSFEDYVPSTSTEDCSKDAAGIVYTSGTSGAPKGAILSNGALNAMAQRLPISLNNLERGDKFLLIMPPFIAYGLAIGLHSQLCCGQTLVLVPEFTIENSKEMLYKEILKHKPQTIMGVPNFMNELIENPKLENVDLSYIKNFIVGGDAITNETEINGNKFLKDHGSNAVISTGYGQTELASCITFTNSDIENKTGSVGIPATEVDIRVLDTEGMSEEELENANIDDLREVSYGEKGEMFSASPTRMTGYLDSSKENGVFYKSIDGKTYVRSADIGYVDNDGYVYVNERKKRIVIRPDGHNVSAFAIEQIINSDPRVKQSCVVGRTAEGYEQGQWPVAYIELKDEFKNQGIEEDLINNLNNEQSLKLPGRDVAKYYEFIDELPLTDIGKIDFKKLQQMEDEMVNIKIGR